MFFFFFMQKTAYEMRISDWSSDVCSSDLAAPWQCLYLLPEPHGHGALRLISSPSKGFSPFAPPGPTSARGEPASEPNSSGRSADQIGRASGRERVCTYV